MVSSTPTPTSRPPRQGLRQRRARQPGQPWAVTVIGWLLVLEALGFLSLGALYLGALGPRWSLTPQGPGAERMATVTGLVFGVLALLALIGALGFFRRRRGAWVSAVFVQGAVLLIALALYFRGRPAYVYGMMVYGIFMVLYLHQADVQAAFRAAGRPDVEEQA